MSDLNSLLSRLERTSIYANGYHSLNHKVYVTHMFTRPTNLNRYQNVKINYYCKDLQNSLELNPYHGMFRLHTTIITLINITVTN